MNVAEGGRVRRCREHPKYGLTVLVTEVFRNFLEISSGQLPACADIRGVWCPFFVGYSYDSGAAPQTTVRR